MQLRHIMVATDLSSTAEVAERRAAAIARHAGAKLSLLYAQATDVEISAAAVESGAAIALAELAAEQAVEVARTMKARADALRATGLDVRVEIRSGAPDETVETLVPELAVDLVVIGTHGRTGIKRFLLGSVAERIVRRAPCPVLVVRGDAPDDGVFRRALVATDFSPAATAAIDAAFALVGPDAHVRALHAWQYPVGTWGALAEHTAAFAQLRAAIVDDAQRRGQELTEACAARGHVIAFELENGSPASVVTDAAARDVDDLVVIGTHGYRGLRRFILGSVAEAITRHAPCSVLVAHAPHARHAPHAASV